MSSGQPKAPRPKERDVFPRTAATWIAAKLGDGENGRAEINRHVMSVYAWPLEVYFLGCADRWVGEAGDVVRGFLASRLGREGFFQDWQQSGLRLRRWLMNAFSYYLHELRRERKKGARVVDLPADLPADAEDPSEAMDRAFAVSIVRAAMERAAEACEAQGLTPHWHVFLNHFFHGKAYGEFARFFGVDPARAAVMARTASQKFQSALRELVARDGATEEEIDQDLGALLEAVGS